MSRFDYSLLNATISDGGVRDLSPLSIALAIMALSNINHRYLWSNGGIPLDDNDWDNLDNALSTALDELMYQFVGLVVPAVFASASLNTFLLCDGGIYFRDDYPLLYDALDTRYIVSGTQFSVPDLRNRFPVGTGGGYALGDTGGADSITLQINQIPPHTHTYTSPTFGIDIESVGVPDPTGVGNPPVVLTSSSAGGGQSHENRPPYYALDWYIIAG